jgi:hypothetical protein
LAESLVCARDGLLILGREDAPLASGFAMLSLRIVTIITASRRPTENNRNAEKQPTPENNRHQRKQPKVDKILNVHIIDLVIMAIREMKSHHIVASDFQNSLLFFPVLRENGAAVGAASLWMIGGRVSVCLDTIYARCKIVSWR